MTDLPEEIVTDVLVVGGGGAGARAAIEAKAAGAEVLLAVKGTFGGVGVRGSGSTAGGVSDRGGIDYPGARSIQGFRPGNGAMSVQQDYDRIIQLGLGMADPKLAAILAEEGNEACRVLSEQWGAEVFPRQWGIMSHGVPVLLALARQVRASGVAVREYTMVVDVLVHDGRIAGAVAVDERTGKSLLIRCGAVVLATGGAGGMFRHHLTSDCTTGDGYAMALRAGAGLMNMEFKQVFPGTVWPTINHFSAWFFVPHVKILNARGEPYVHKYLPDGVELEEVYRQRGSHGPFSARDSASRYFDVASIIETKAGHANEHDALYVDLTDPRVTDPLHPARREYFYYRGIRYMDQPVEFNICFHCSNGGVRTDENAMSRVVGLYAAGECAAGPHGANRMAGHMLGASQVFGRRSGRHAAAAACGSSRPEAGPLAGRALEEIEAVRSRRTGEKPREVIRDLQWLMWNNLLVHVNAQTIATAAQGLREIARRLADVRVEDARDLVDAMELRNMALVGEALAVAIDLRKESRGDQYREDYPQRDDANWNRVIVLDYDGREISAGTEVLDAQWPRADRPENEEGFRWG